MHLSPDFTYVTTQEQACFKELLDATRKEVTQLTLQLRQYDGESMSVIISHAQMTRECGYSLDEVQLLKKISGAKSFEIAQLQAKLMAGEDEFFMTVL